MKKKVVGLVGFFGWGNFGDELFVETYKHWLGKDYELRVLNDLIAKPYFSRPLKEVLAGVDAIVIGGGDLILPWTVSELYWRAEYLELPVFIVGVGVPTWKASSEPAIQRQAKFFQHPNVRMVEARDRESADWITKHLQPKVPVGASADIVFALPMPKLPASHVKGQVWGKPRVGGKPMLGIVTRDRKGEPDDLTHVLALCKKATELGFGIRHLILGVGDVGRRDLARASDLDVPGKEVAASDSLWDLCTAIGTCEAIASMKYHGTVVAVAYGVPSMVLSPTDKSRNLMRMIERPELLSSLADPRLKDRFSPYMASVPTTSRRMLRQRAESAMKQLIGGLQAL